MESKSDMHDIFRILCCEYFGYIWHILVIIEYFQTPQIAKCLSIYTHFEPFVSRESIFISVDFHVNDLFVNFK